MKMELNHRKQKFLMKNALLLFQLEIWKNEITLDKDLMKIIEEKKIEIPPNLGSAMVLFKTCKVVDPQLFENIRDMDTLSALKEINRKWNVADTQEDLDGFVIPGQQRVVQVPDNIKEIASKIEKGEKLTAEDLLQDNNPKTIKKMEQQADMKVVRDDIFSKPKIVKNK